MPWGAVAGAAVGLIGSSMQADATKDAAESAGKIDPRMDKWVYGLDDGSTKGLLGNLADWYQNNQSGMNDQMRQGLNQQWSTLTNPFTMAGYDQMARAGSGLMGTPVMGNPFSDGRASLMTQPQMGGMSGGLMAGQPRLGGPALGGSPTQGSQQFPSYQPIMAPPSPGGLTGPFTAPPPAPAAPPAAPKDDGRFMMTPVGYEQFYQGDGGNMYRKRPDGSYWDVYTTDFGTGNGGA